MKTDSAQSRLLLEDLNLLTKQSDDSESQYFCISATMIFLTLFVKDSSLRSSKSYKIKEFFGVSYGRYLK